MIPEMRSSGNLTSAIVEVLGKAIVSGRYGEDNPFPNEGALVRQFGVSRSILREAVKMLTTKGLLNARPRHGTWITPESDWNFLDPDVLTWMLGREFSPQLLLQFNEIRLAIEPQAAALAASRGTPEHKAAIGAALDRMMAADRGEDDPLESDIAFHHAVLAATRNRFYVELTKFIDTALRFSIRRTNSYKGVAMASILEHKRVSDAIAAGDVETARSAMHALIFNVINLIEQQNPDKPQARAATAS